MSLPYLLLDSPKSYTLTVALAHGAGAPMDSEFMAFFATGLATRGYRTVRFEFPYMAERRVNGKKRPPDRQPKLMKSWQTIINEIGPDSLVIGGKSMGGRIATLIADSCNVMGVIALGYPFLSAGKRDKSRLEHLKDILTPTLICQGTRDPMGSFDAISRITLSHRIQYHWSENGDHSLKPGKKSGRTTEQNWMAALNACDNFLHRLS